MNFTIPNTRMIAMVLAAIAAVLAVLGVDFGAAEQAALITSLESMVAAISAVVAIGCELLERFASKIDKSLDPDA